MAEELRDESGEDRNRCYVHFKLCPDRARAAWLQAGHRTRRGRKQKEGGEDRKRLLRTLVVLGPLHNEAAFPTTPCHNDKGGPCDVFVIVDAGLS